MRRSLWSRWIASFLGRGAALVIVALSGAPSVAAQESRDGASPSGPPPAVVQMHDLFADGQWALGTRAFYAACAAGDSLVLEALWVDLRGLATAEELKEWQESEEPPSASRCDLLRSMTAERAERAGQSVGERLATHFERLAKVREDYWLPSKRVQGGAADSLGRHPDLMFDDRGLIYLRMGEPDDVAYAIAGSPDSMGNRVEAWAYDRPEGRRIFFFSPITALSVGSMDFRLLDAPWRAVGVRYGATQLDLVNMADLELRGGGEAPLKNLLLAFQGLDPYYATLAYRSVRGGTQLLQDLTKERQRTLADVKFAIDSVPDAPAVEPVVRFAWERLRFLDPSTARTVVWLLAGVRAGDLAVDSESEDRIVYRIDLAAAVRTADSVARDSVHAEYRLPAELSEEDALIARLPVTVGPGKHTFTMTVSDANTVRDANTADDEPGRKPAGNWTRGTITGIALAELPEISDIAVAADSGGTWTRDGVTFLAVTPSHTTDSEGRVHLYFESYGLAPGSTYAVEVRVVPEDSADRMWQMDAGETTFRLSFNSEMPDGGIGTHHLRLDLSDTRPGDYRLGIRVREPVSGRESLPSTAPIVRPD